MKKLIAYMFLLLTVTACNKKDPSSAPDHKGTITALRNGSVWTPQIGGFYENQERKDRVTLIVSDYHNDFLWDEVWISNITTIANTYTLKDKKQWLLSTDPAVKTLPYINYNGSFNEGSDVYNPHYISDEITPQITITSFDDHTNELKGTFQIAFRLYDTVNPLRILDSVIYRDAVFSVTVQTKEAFFGQ